MILVLMLFALLSLTPCLGYWLYRKWKLSILLAVGQRWHEQTLGYESLDWSALSAGITTQQAADGLARAFTSIGRYYPDTDIIEIAPYVKQEFEESTGEMLQVEML